MREFDDGIDDMSAAMRGLRKAIRGVPAEQQGFKGAHDRLTRDVALLLMEMEETAAMADSEK